MGSVLPHVLGVVAPVVLCALVGFGLAKLRQPFDRKALTPIITNVGIPALVISHLSEQHVSASALAGIMLAALTALACFGVLATVALKALRLPLRAYLASLIFANTGNVGLPISSLAFGDQGLAYAIAFWVVSTIGLFTVGTWIPQGGVSFARVIRSPTIYAVVVGMALLATETPLPTPLHHALDILGGLPIPLMLLTLGHTMAELKPDLLARGLALSLVHLAMVALVAWVLAPFFHLEGVARGVFILQCLMPVAVTNYLFTEMYDEERAPEVASLLLFSTALTIVVLPLALAYWI
jgi:predicted permease